MPDKAAGSESHFHTTHRHYSSYLPLWNIKRYSSGLPDKIPRYDEEVHWWYQLHFLFLSPLPRLSQCPFPLLTVLPACSRKYWWYSCQYLSEGVLPYCPSLLIYPSSTSGFLRIHYLHIWSKTSYALILPYYNLGTVLPCPLIPDNISCRHNH